MFCKRSRLIISKAILLVMVFASLAPTLSYAFASTGSIGGAGKSLWQEVCSAQGAKRIATGFTVNAPTSAPATNRSSIPTAMHFEHCPFCLSHVAALPMVDSVPLVILDTGRFFLQTYYLAPVLTALFQSDHPSRAPPL